MSSNTIKRIITDEIRHEKELVSFMEDRLQKLPEGWLYLDRRYADSYCLQKFRVGGRQKSIVLDPLDDLHRQVIKELMEKKTIVHGLPILRRNVDAMEKCASKIRSYHPLDFKYGELLGSEYYLPEDVCIREWRKKEECQNPFRPEDRIHETKRGVNVRSKSEMLIADTLFDHGLEYKNETKLRLEGRNYYPDFEILHPKTRRIIWWEHLGKLADPGYVFENLDRIVVFGRNGIVVGDNLILTWETQEMPLTHGMVDQRLREFGLI